MWVAAMVGVLIQFGRLPADSRGIYCLTDLTQYISNQRSRALAEFAVFVLLGTIATLMLSGCTLGGTLMTGVGFAAVTIREKKV